MPECKLNLHCVMSSLHYFPFRDLLSEFTEPAFVIKANAPEFSLLAANFEPVLAGELEGLRVSGSTDIYSLLEPGQSGHQVLEAGLNECLHSGRVIWLSGISFFGNGLTEAASCCQLKILPFLNPGGSIDYLLITSHLMFDDAA